MSKDIEPRNNKEQAHGYWEIYYYNGDLWYKIFYHNGKKVGYEEWYHWNNSNDNVTRKTYYL
jgi:antitoxin component YwqK of YwqJK toxin-antitoxin module